MNLASEKSDCSASSKNYSENDVEQRSSLPDIPLTNREKAELENSMLMQNSQSSESVLQGLIPPPKPSKDRKPSAPPLPPKKKTCSIDDEPDNLMLMASNELRYDRRLDFDRFDEPDFNMSERGKSFSSVETSLTGSKSVKHVEATNSTKSMISTQFHNVNESNFSMDLKECNINITSQEFNSRVFQTTSSDMHDLDGSFSFMSMNPNEFLMDQKMKSNENFSAIEQRPPLPIKMRSRSLRMEHHKSVYDNVDDVNRISLDAKASMTSSNSSLTSSLSARTENTSDSSHQIKVQSDSS